MAPAEHESVDCDPEAKSMLDSVPWSAFDASMLEASARYMASYLFKRADLNRWPFRMDFCGQQLRLRAMKRVHLSMF